MNPILNLETGRFSALPPQFLRTLGELQSLFLNPSGIEESRKDEPVYEIHGPTAEQDGPPRLLYATTVLHPGQVNGEYFMTRGHFHTDPTRGEFMLTLRGQGALMLMERSRRTWTEPMSPGSVHDIDGHHAHRVINTGSDPLVFLVVWMSDCGHEYESIREQGFGDRLIAKPVKDLETSVRE